MPILVCGSEGDWALFENTLDITVGNDDKRRGSVALSVGQQMFKAYTGTTDIWAHARIATSSGSATGQEIFVIRDGTGSTIVDLNDLAPINNDLTNIQIRRKQTNAGGLVANAEQFAQATQAFHNWDIRIQITTTTTANDTMTISVYRDEILRFTETNVDATGWPVPEQILCQSRSTTSGNDSTYFQDIIVTASVPTVGMELATLVPSAVGNYDQFTNNYTNIDDLGYNQSTVISTDAVAQRESWIFSTPVFNLNDKVIYGVITNTVAQRDLAGTIADFRPFLRIDAADYDGTVLGAGTIAPDSFVTEYLVNPATTQPWTQAQLVGLESGIRSV